MTFFVQLFLQLFSKWPSGKPDTFSSRLFWLCLKVLVFRSQNHSLKILSMLVWLVRGGRKPKTCTFLKDATLARRNVQGRARCHLKGYCMYFQGNRLTVVLASKDQYLSRHIQKSRLENVSDFGWAIFKRIRLYNSFCTFFPRATPCGSFEWGPPRVFFTSFEKYKLVIFMTFFTSFVRVFRYNFLYFRAAFPLYISEIVFLGKNTSFWINVWTHIFWLRPCI